MVRLLIHTQLQTALGQPERSLSVQGGDLSARWFQGFQQQGSIREHSIDFLSSSEVLPPGPECCRQLSDASALVQHCELRQKNGLLPRTPWLVSYQEAKKQSRRSQLSGGDQGLLLIGRNGPQEQIDAPLLCALVSAVQQLIRQPRIDLHPSERRACLPAIVEALGLSQCQIPPASAHLGDVPQHRAADRQPNSIGDASDASSGNSALLLPVPSFHGSGA